MTNPITCPFCGNIFQNNKGGQFTNHLAELHGMSYEDYVVATQYNGIPPVCSCGLCEARPVFYRGSYKKMALGHDRFEFQEKRYVEKYGIPRCLTCGLELHRFIRGKPRKYCSTSCQGKQQGFSKPETQATIRRVVLEKYGVDNISKLDSVRKQISASNIGKVILVSAETKKKHSESSTANWRIESVREKRVAGIRKGVNRPEERKRRSEFAKSQMNNKEHLQLFFGSGFGHLSKPHKYIRNVLQLERHGFLSEQLITPYIVDELCEERKLIIEINGDYIHANPKKYKPDSIIRIPGKSYTAQEKWDLDKQRIEYLNNKGYEALVIWESDDMEEWKRYLETRFAT